MNNRISVISGGISHTFSMFNNSTISGISEDFSVYLVVSLKTVTILRTGQKILNSN